MTPQAKEGKFEISDQVRLHVMFLSLNVETSHSGILLP